MRDGRKAESIASVSGFATRGVSADVVRLLVAEHELWTGEGVLRETRRILTERFGVPDEIGWRLRQRHVEPLPELSSPVDVRGPDDETVPASAIAAEAKIRVSGDMDLLNVADQVDALRIMTPGTLQEEVRQLKNASRRESVQDAHFSRGRFCQVRKLIRFSLETGAAWHEQIARRFVRPDRPCQRPRHGSDVPARQRKR